MTKIEVMALVVTAPARCTNFDDPHWAGLDQAVLNSCFDDGLIRWNAGKLALTPLGSSGCGGSRYSSGQMGTNERKV